jgi:para-nitrobenzyl esterase
MLAHPTRFSRSSRFTLGLILGLAALIAGGTWRTRIASASSSDPVIDTKNGQLQGTVGAQMIEYLGIPYAAAPVGASRWTPPESFGKWTGIFQAITFGSECPQMNPSEVVVGNENCLFMNVYTPVDADTTKPHDRAVMVWIHGGGLTQGAGADYDPTPLVEKGDVIVVTFNYRLGLLGFFAEESLDAEGHLAGNYGLMDQQFALGWVQRNIAAFGGDPTRVTVFGESAGGLSVYSQLASPLASGLFQQAISQSGAYAGFSPDYRAWILPIATAETTGDLPFVQSGATMATDVGCSSGDSVCLRAVTPTALVNAQVSTKDAIVPTIDGTLLTQTPGDAFSSGDFNHVPVITGNNHDEYRYFVANDFALPIMNPQYGAVFTTVFASLATDVETEYPLSSTPPVNGAELKLAAAGTDGIFVCPARRAEMSLSQHATVYAYEFDDKKAPAPAFPGLNFRLLAYDSADVQYLFDRSSTLGPLDHRQTQLSDAMIRYWTEFAKNGDPNSSANPNWAPYVSAIDERQFFSPPTPTVESGSTFDTFHRCSSYWDKF